MRTRNASATPAKKTPPARKTKTAAKAQSTLSPVDTAPPPESQTKEITPPKPGPTTRGKQVKSTDVITTPVQDITPPPKPKPEPESAAAEDLKAVNDALETQLTSESKPAKDDQSVSKGVKGKTKRVVKRVIRKTVIRSTKNPKSGETIKVEEIIKDNDMVEKPLVTDVETEKKDEPSVSYVETPAINEEPSVENIEGDNEANSDIVNVEESTKKPEVENIVGDDKVNSDILNVEESIKKVESKAEQSLTEGVTKSPKEQELPILESKFLEDHEVAIHQKMHNMEDYPNEEKTDFDGLLEEGDDQKLEGIADQEIDQNEEKTDFDGLLEEGDDDDKIEGIADQELHDEEVPEDDVLVQGEEVIEDECIEINAVAKEHKLRKELEIFVGGLDRNVTEEDLKRVFQNAGEVVDVCLHKDPSTNKNKGYAFVRFATKDQVNRALSEMKNPVIRGKRCGVAPSEDNDSLFVGNICNTWTKEAIQQKLKDYGIEGVEKITLVADPKHEGLSRGFAFLEFSSHAEAMLAYKRLQKPDAIFGHPERTVKVAFAEPLREPNPEVMAQVKSVFVDGLPPQWDEDRVKEKFKCFGEIANVVLARNMTTAKRKDFGFVDFTTHEAAAACIESVNNMELGDGNSKVKVRARLSNPLPKTQAVKGGMAGGFRIARGGGRTHAGFGRGFGRGGHALNPPNFQHDRGFNPHGLGQSGRMGFVTEHEFGNTFPMRGRHNSEHGGRWGFRGAHQGSTGGPPPNRLHYDRFSHGGYSNYDPLRREPFPPEVGFNRPYPERHIDDRYFYDDPARGMKRPYSMRDQVHLDPGYLEPSARRPRFDHSQSSASFHGNRYPDSFGVDGGCYQQDYYGSDYRQGAYPPFRGGHRPYGRGHY